MYDTLAKMPCKSRQGQEDKVSLHMAIQVMSKKAYTFRRAYENIIFLAVFKFLGNFIEQKDTRPM